MTRKQACFLLAGYTISWCPRTSSVGFSIMTTQFTESELIDRFVRAVARKEGFFDKKKIPTVAQRCNNPLNLTHWKDRAGNPYPTNNGYVEFPDEETGWRAGKAQCRINIMKRKLTWFEFFAGRPGVYSGFCPRDDNRDRMLRKNDPLGYARDVLSMVAGQDAPLMGIHSPIIDLLGDAGASGQRAA